VWIDLAVGGCRRRRRCRGETEARRSSSEKRDHIAGSVSASDGMSGSLECIPGHVISRSRRRPEKTSHHMRGVLQSTSDVTVIRCQIKRLTPSLFHSRLKTYLFHKSYPPPIVSLLPPGLPSRTFACIVSSELFGFWFYFFLIFRFWAESKIKLAISSAFERTLIHRVVTWDDKLSLIGVVRVTWPVFF